MEAPSLGRNFSVDWEEAEEYPRSWNEIIEGHQHHVSIPQRLILPCGKPAWEDSARTKGLLSLLQSDSLRSNPDWDSAAQPVQPKRPASKSACESACKIDPLWWVMII